MSVRNFLRDDDRETHRFGLADVAPLSAHLDGFSGLAESNAGLFVSARMRSRVRST